MSLVEFEKWFDDEYSNYGKSYKERYDERNDMYSSQFVDERYDAFKAGQQSQQGEVNKLQTKIDLLEKELTETQAFLNKQNHIKQAKIDELQGWIDRALKELELLNYYRTGNSDNAINILKGNKDERCLYVKPKDYR